MGHRELVGGTGQYLNQRIELNRVLELLKVLRIPAFGGQIGS
jgi:hypothetical protein